MSAASAPPEGALAAALLATLSPDNGVRRAAEQQLHAPALRALGEVYEVGRAGVARDARRAAQLYEAAAAVAAGTFAGARVAAQARGALVRLEIREGELAQLADRGE